MKDFHFNNIYYIYYFLSKISTLNLTYILHSFKTSLICIFVVGMNILFLISISDYF